VTIIQKTVNSEESISIILNNRRIGHDGVIKGYFVKALDNLVSFVAIFLPATAEYQKV
jgi:hypothetical protein